MNNHIEHTHIVTCCRDQEGFWSLADARKYAKQRLYFTGKRVEIRDNMGRLVEVVS